MTQDTKSYIAYALLMVMGTILGGGVYIFIVFNLGFLAWICLVTGVLCWFFGFAGTIKKLLTGKEIYEE